MKRASKACCAFIVAAMVASLLSCNSHIPLHRNSGFLKTLKDYAREAKERGSREVAVPYALDEEEGEMIELRSVDEALSSYEWVLGEPIEEKTLTLSTLANSPEPDSI